MWVKNGCTIKAKDIGVNDNKYEVESGTSVTINHILALKFYTDFTNEQKSLCEACRKITKLGDFVSDAFIVNDVCNWYRHIGSL